MSQTTNPVKELKNLRLQAIKEANKEYEDLANYKFILTLIENAGLSVFKKYYSFIQKNETIPTNTNIEVSFKTDIEKILTKSQNDFKNIELEKNKSLELINKPIINPDELIKIIKKLKTEQEKYLTKITQKKQEIISIIRAYTTIKTINLSQINKNFILEAANNIKGLLKQENAKGRKKVSTQTNQSLQAPAIVQPPAANLTSPQANKPRIIEIPYNGFVYKVEITNPIGNENIDKICPDDDLILLGKRLTKAHDQRNSLNLNKRINNKCIKIIEIKPQEKSGGKKPLNKCTVAELRKKCQKKKITGYSSMNKATLIAHLRVKK